MGFRKNASGVVSILSFFMYLLVQNATTDRPLSYHELESLMIKGSPYTDIGLKMNTESVNDSGVPLFTYGENVLFSIASNNVNQFPTDSNSCVYQDQNTGLTIINNHPNIAIEGLMEYCTGLIKQAIKENNEFLTINFNFTYQGSVKIGDLVLDNPLFTYQYQQQRFNVTGSEPEELTNLNLSFYHNYQNYSLNIPINNTGELLFDKLDNNQQLNLNGKDFFSAYPEFDVFYTFDHEFEFISKIVPGSEEIVYGLLKLTENLSDFAETVYENSEINSIQ